MTSKKKLPPATPEQKKFASGAKRLLRDVAAYVADGGDVVLSTKTEIGFFKRRDKLEDQLRALELQSDPVSIQLMRDAKEACSAAPAAASATRKRYYAAQIERLDRMEDERLKSEDWYTKELRHMHRHGTR